MTLLFYLKPSNGALGTNPGPYQINNDFEWAYDGIYRKKKKKALQKRLEKVRLELLKYERAIRLRKDEEDLLLLLMHEFDEFDD